MAVVFLGLIVLYLVFKQIGNAAIKASKRNAQKAAAAEGSEVSANAGQESGEIFAAIATALYEMSDDNHDIEDRYLPSAKYNAVIHLGALSFTHCVRLQPKSNHLLKLRRTNEKF